MSEPDIPEPTLARVGRIAGIDFGTVRIGVAVCDPSQSIASPVATYRRRSKELDAEYFRELVAAEELIGFVVGLPVHMSGQPSKKSREAMTFGRWLSQQAGLPVDWMDERYSTAFARELLNQAGGSGRKKKDRLDSVAAQVILAAYLERRNAT